MKRFFILASFIALFSIPSAAFAVTLMNPLGYTSLTEFLRRLLQLVAQIGFPVIVLFIIYIGFQFVSAQGNADKLKKVRENFFWAIVGALIVLGAEALSLAIEATVQQLQG
jgi:TRAP-type C4-dicarboxylate transport system permease small subunit